MNKQTLLIKNVCILLPDMSVLKNAFLATDGMKISYIGTKMPEGKFDTVKDGKSNLITPAFYNVHAHSPMTIFRGFGENLPLMRWLNEKIFPAEAKLTGEDAYYGTLLACAEMIKSGTACCTDMYFFTEEIARAFSDTKLKSNPAPCVTYFGEGKIEDMPVFGNYLKLKENFKDDEFVMPEFSVHAEYTNTKESVTYSADFAKEHEINLQIHLSETKDEQKDCFEKYKKTPTEFFEDCGIFDRPVCAAHCVYCTKNDFDIMKSHGATAVSCPASNMKLASGIIDANAMLDSGVNFALGTDGPASNNSLSMIETMKQFSLLQKVDKFDASLITPEQIFKAATVNGAKAQHRELCGTIETGNFADFVLWDTSAPEFNPMYDPCAAIVYAANPSNVLMTVVNGRILYEGGEFKTLDTEKVIYEVNKRCPR